MRNRQTMNSLESASLWLHIRGAIVSAFDDFVFPNKESYTRTQNKEENKRYFKKIKIMMDALEEKWEISYANLKDQSFLQELRSFTGLELVGDKKLLLNSSEIGLSKFKSFVEDRIILRNTDINATISKSNIPTFDSAVEKKKKARTPNHEREELQLQTKIISVSKDRDVIPIDHLPKYQIS